MKVFFSKDFDGHYPVPTAAVVIAEDEQAADALLRDELTKAGLPQDRAFTVHRIDTRVPKAFILSDGNY